MAWQVGVDIGNVKVNSFIVYNNKQYSSVEELKRENPQLSNDTEVTVVNLIDIGFNIYNYYQGSHSKLPSDKPVTISGNLDICDPDGKVINSYKFNEGPYKQIDHIYHVAANAIKKVTLGNIFPAAFNVYLNYIVIVSYSGKNITGSDGATGQALWGA